MEFVLTTQQMRESDQIAIEKIGIPGLILMENAGLKAAQCISKKISPISGKSLAILCGKGNNGGDGFVIGRHLNRMGASVHFFLAAKKPSDITGDAKVNFEIVQSMGLSVTLLTQSDSTGDLNEYDVVVDALLGTGLKGNVTGLLAELIKKMNRSEAVVVAIDTPSGLDCDTGSQLGCCTEADMTITMGQLKTGMMLYPGRGLVGDLFVADLSVPPKALDGLGSKYLLPEPIDYQSMLPDRPEDSYKNKFGRILVAAGSTGLSGAAKLCSESALRSGAGMVMLACPRSLNSVFENSLTEVMTIPLPETESGTISNTAYKALEEWVEWSHVAAVGPGISRDRETRDFVRYFVETQRKPLVIDADGLNNLAGKTEILEKHDGDIVITPHAGEFSRLIEKPVKEISKSPVELVRDYSQKWRVVILLKGPTTIIGTPAGDIYFNLSGNAGLATAGSGDVLTGIIAGLMGQGLKGADAAVLGSFLHGLAADQVAAVRGMRGILAGDLLDAIPGALSALEKFEGSSGSSLIQHGPIRLY